MKAIDIQSKKISLLFLEEQGHYNPNDYIANIQWPSVGELTFPLGVNRSLKMKK
jgi:hypothetical protein